MCYVFFGFIILFFKNRYYFCIIVLIEIVVSLSVQFWCDGVIPLTH